MSNRITSFICAIAAVLATTITFSEVTTVPAARVESGAFAARAA
ncbi:hypothetical protein [Qipengyuania sphaerica]|nr:hypothetical protein [Qipengyuania sphaerica]